MNTKFSYIQLFLRFTIGIGYLYPVMDRFGFLGQYGEAGIFWGDWKHFSDYAHQLLFFLPRTGSDVLAMLATAFELLFGWFLIIGWFTRLCAIGSSFLALGFALCMWLAFGIGAPLGYSVFTLSAASLALAAVPAYKWSLDSIGYETTSSYSMQLQSS